MARKRGKIPHKDTTQGILSPIFHTKAATAVAVRMHRSQQCAAPLAAQTQGFTSPQCPNPGFVSSLQELRTAFAAVAAYLCWTSVLCDAKQVEHKAPGADVGHWKILGRCVVLMCPGTGVHGLRPAKFYPSTLGHAVALNICKILPFYPRPRRGLVALNI